MSVIRMSDYREKSVRTMTEYVKNQTVGNFNNIDIIVWADVVKTWFDSESCLIGLQRSDDGDVLYAMPCNEDGSSISRWQYFCKTHFRQLIDKSGKTPIPMKTMIISARLMLKSEYRVEIVRSFPKKYKLDQIV